MLYPSCINGDNLFDIPNTVHFASAMKVFRWLLDVTDITHVYCCIGAAKHWPSQVNHLPSSMERTIALDYDGYGYTYRCTADSEQVSAARWPFKRAKCKTRKRKWSSSKVTNFVFFFIDMWNASRMVFGETKCPIFNELLAGQRLQ